MASRRLAAAPSIDALRDIARRRVPRMAFDYMDGGAETEQGLARNRSAFGDITLTPRYFTDVSSRTSEVDLLGRRYGASIGIAPTGLAGLVWPGADAALALAAKERRLPFVLSTPATLTIEAAAALAPGLVWFQLYVMNDRAITEDLLRRAHAAGIEVIVVTVDIPVPAKRERDIRNGFTLPLRPSLTMAWDVARHPAWALAMLKHGTPQFANLAPYAPAKSTSTQSLAAFMASQISSAVTWDVIDWIRSIWPGRMLVKGILSAADATAALDHRVDGIVVSNHGGRQFDAAPASIEALPAIVAAVAGRMPVLLDSGIRRGLDVAKAMALGADLTFVGRATLYGAGAGGDAGVKRALDILHGELMASLGQLGCTCVDHLRKVDWQTPRLLQPNKNDQ